MPKVFFPERPWGVFSDDAVQRLHHASMRLLARTGVRVDSDDGLALLESYGVRCDRSSRRVYPSEDNVQRALETVRLGYTLYGRYGRADAAYTIAPDTIHTISGGAAVTMHEQGQYRPVTREDLVRMVRLHEQLDNVHILLNPVEPMEMREGTLYVQMAADMFCHSSKPLLLQADSASDVEKLVRMAGACGSGVDTLREKPLFMTGANAEPPLCIPAHAVEVLVTAARHGVPVSLGSYLMMGSTGPLDVAGAVVQRTATVLCGLLLTQAAAPGSVFDMACHSGGCDMSSGDVVTMSPTVLQLLIGSVQMARYFGLPAHSLAATESARPDAQAAAERAMSMWAAVHSGASLVQGVTTEMAGMEVADVGQCVIDDEIAGYVLACASGASMEQYDDAVRAIEQVAEQDSGEGLFLGHEHTVRRCREESWHAGLFEYGGMCSRLSKERRDIYDKACARAQELLERPGVSVDPALRAQVYAIAGEVPEA